MSFLYHRNAQNPWGFQQAMITSVKAQGEKGQESEEKDKEPPVRIKIKDDE